MLIGYQVFDSDVNIAGVIANMTGGSRHESKLRAAVEHYTDIPFLGALDKDSSISIDEQHIGLIPGYEEPQSDNKISIIADAVNDHIDLDRLIEIAATAPENKILVSKPDNIVSFHGITIGIAQDPAFGFYYPGDLDAMRTAGAEIVPINTLTDSELPLIDGLFIGGGFPERYAAELEANIKLRNSIKAAIENGLPAYAECGGLMYLSRSLNWQGKTFDMVGAIPGDTRMHEKSCGRGYVKLEEISGVFPWESSNDPTALVHAHEFHYSSIDGLAESTQFAYTVRRGSGINHQSDGLIYKNPMASYSHLRNTRATPWVERFLSFVSDIKAGQKNGQKMLAQSN